ncbi:MAG: DNA polymerase Y family protein, partial [Acetobacteraceae bacterium]
MRRVVSLFLPTWPTDRLRRRSALPAETPVVTRAHDGRRLVVAAADAAAAYLGLHPDMPLAHAQALIPGLHIADADPTGDTAALDNLATWCLRYAPLTAADPPDNVWIDAAGCAHLFGGEAAMLADMTRRLTHGGIAARAAIADTPGAAHAVARYGGKAVISEGGVAQALSPLPVAALRLAPETAAALHTLGLDRIGQLAAAPRGPLARRFGFALLTHLDQALGRIAEPITPILPRTFVQHRLSFVEPLLTAEAFATVIATLTETVCVVLDRAGLGALRLDLMFERVDATMQAVRIGLSRPTRAPRHLARLLVERLETVDPGLGIEAMRLVVSLAEVLTPVQIRTGLIEEDEPDIGALVDHLRNRFGAARVYRALPVQSDVPERSVRRVPALAPEDPARWPDDLPRPARLLARPQRVQALSVLPDHPPAAFVWRRVRHRIRHADGPERINGEWWHREREAMAVRDYWAVEDEDGRRFW